LIILTCKIQLFLFRGVVISQSSSGFFCSFGCGDPNNAIDLFCRPIIRKTDAENQVIFFIRIYFAESSQKYHCQNKKYRI